MRRSPVRPRARALGAGRTVRRPSSRPCHMQRLDGRVPAPGLLLVVRAPWSRSRRPARGQVDPPARGAPLHQQGRRAAAASSRVEAGPAGAHPCRLPLRGHDSDHGRAAQVGLHRKSTLRPRVDSPHALRRPRSRSRRSPASSGPQRHVVVPGRPRASKARARPSGPSPAYSTAPRRSPPCAPARSSITAEPADAGVGPAPQQRVGVGTEHLDRSTVEPYRLLSVGVILGRQAARPG